ncbi:MAG: hypothetical protein HKN50_10745, partial [Gammaproteobacteria bacterium]|nr:hypothetical protein [Gammaproteobacteria bacterium]
MKIPGLGFEGGQGVVLVFYVAGDHVDDWVVLAVVIRCAAADFELA